MSRAAKTLRRTAGAIAVLVAAICPAFALAQELELIEPGKLHVALNGDMPGTGVENGQLKGLDGEVMAWVASQLGLEVAPEMMDWAAEIASVQTGRVDIMHGMMAWSAEREKVMGITDPIYYVGPVITQRKDQNWDSLKDLEGSTFGTITGFALIPDLKRVPGLNLKLYDTSDAAIRDLIAGRVDAIYADPPLIHWAIKQNPDWPIHYTFIKEYNPEYPVLTGRYGVVFATNKKNEKLVEAFNAQIKKMWETCENWKIAEKYGMAEKDWFTPPTVKNLRIGVDRPEDWKDPTLGAGCAPK